MKIKLAILSEENIYEKNTAISGSLVQLDFLSKGFLKFGIEVHFISSVKNIKNIEIGYNSNINYHWIEKKRGLLDWKQSLSEYEKQLYLIKPNAIYIRGRSPLQYVASRYKDKNNCICVWGTNGKDGAELWKSTKRLFYSNRHFLRKIVLCPFSLYKDYYINKGMRNSEIIVNQTLDQKESTAHHLKKNGIVIPNYFPFLPKKEKKENLILWMSSISVNKQPELFFKLIRNIDLQSWQATLVGSTANESYSEFILDKCRELSIDFPGKIEFQDSYKIYQKAKLYINTSKNKADGLPNSFIQSWLAGIPVLSLNHNPNSWLEKYKIGYCFNGDFDKLKEKVQYLINNPSIISKMGKNAEKFAKEKFTSKKIIEKYISIFNNNHD